MWPDVLEDIGKSIHVRMLAAGEEIPVYIGASAGVPTKDQINVIRGVSSPVATGICKDTKQTAYIEVWVGAVDQHDDSKLTDQEYENSQTLAGYKRLQTITDIIIKKELRGDNPAYRSIIAEILPDNDEFRPVCANRIEYQITL